VLVNDGAILLQRHPQATKWGLPGGAIEIDESITEALEREFIEETGIEVKPLQILAAEDGYFYMHDRGYKAIAMLYKVEMVGGKILANGNGEDTVEVKFVQLSELKSEDLLPFFRSLSLSYLGW